MKTGKKTMPDSKCTNKRQANNMGHYFILDEPNGPVAEGVCKYCGKKQAHYNAYRPRTKIRRVGKRGDNTIIYADIADFAL